MNKPSFEKLIEWLGEYEEDYFALKDSKVKELLEKIELLETYDRTETCTSGQILENIAFGLFDKEFFDVEINRRTSSNEIDLIVKLTSNGSAILKKFKHHEDYEKFPHLMIVEAKNHNNRVGITYVGKFKALLNATSTKFGIFISAKGLTGRGALGWRDAVGFTKKVATVHEREEDKTIILDISVEDIKEMLETDPNVIKYLMKRKSDFLLDIKSDFEQIEAHPDEETIRNLIQGSVDS